MTRIIRVHSRARRDDVFALRYRAYLNKGAIDSSASGRFADRYDEQPNQILWAVYEDEQMVGSIRSMWFHPGTGWSTPEVDCFRECIAGHVPASYGILSANRFVTEPGRQFCSERYAMLLLRCHLTLVKPLADYAVAAVRTHHLRFYRRTLKLERISEGRIFPGLNCMMYLTGCNASALDSAYRDTPELRPLGEETMFLEHRRQDEWERGIVVRPRADLSVEQETEVLVAA